MSALGIGVDFLQIVSMFTAFGFTWPHELTALFKIASTSTFNEQLMAPECSVSGWGFQMKYAAGFKLFAIASLHASAAGPHPFKLISESVRFGALVVWQVVHDAVHPAAVHFRSWGRDSYRLRAGLSGVFSFSFRMRGDLVTLESHCICFELRHCTSDDSLLTSPVALASSTAAARRSDYTEGLRNSGVHSTARSSATHVLYFFRVHCLLEVYVHHSCLISPRQV